MEFLNLDEKDYPRFLEIYNGSFPADERRQYHDEKHLGTFIRERGGKFHVMTVKDGDYFLGFLSYWTFKGYVYVEHFAVDPAHRGKNIGGKMLEHLLRTVSPDVLLEVEHPENSESERRIRFYERHGFTRSMEFEYIQPPYSPGQQSVPLLLMRHGNVKLGSRSDIAEMLREVYNVAEGI